MTLRPVVPDRSWFSKDVTPETTMRIAARKRRRIDVSHETIRNWEQGKRGPTGAARTLLRILDKAPEIALRVLD